jgi:hypothetical protein
VFCIRNARVVVFPQKLSLVNPDCLFVRFAPVSGATGVALSGDGFELERSAVATRSVGKVALLYRVLNYAVMQAYRLNFSGWNNRMST